MSNYIGSINAKNIDGKNIININTEITNIKGILVANDASFSNVDISENIIVNGDISCNGFIRGDGRYLNGVLRYPDQSTKKGNFLTNDGTNLIWSNDVCFNTLTINNHLDVSGNQYLNGSLDMNNEAYIKLDTTNTIPTNTENPNNSILSLIKVKTNRNYIMWTLSDDIMRIGRMRANEEPIHLFKEYGFAGGSGYRIGDLGPSPSSLIRAPWEKALNIHQQENIGFDINTGIFKIIDSGIYNIIFNCTFEISQAHGVELIVHPQRSAIGTVAVAAPTLSNATPNNELASVSGFGTNNRTSEVVGPGQGQGSGDYIGYGGAHDFSQRGERRIQIGIDIHKNGKTERYKRVNGQAEPIEPAEDYLRFTQTGQMARNDALTTGRSNFTHIAIDTYMELPENSLIMFKYLGSDIDGVSSISKYTHGSICRISI